MTKPKNMRATRNTQVSKIEQYLAAPPVAKANGASSTEASLDMSNIEEIAREPTDNAIIQEIRAMKLDLEGQIQKVGADVLDIKAGLDSLKADVATLGSRVSEAEERVSQLEDDNTRLTSLTESMANTITQLQTRVEYHENYSRRNNLRLTGVPEGPEEGANAVSCVKDILQSLFKDTTESADDIIIERAHRVPTGPKRAQQGPNNKSSRTILVRFLCYADREKVRLRVRKLEMFTWKGSRVDFYPDLTKEVQERRKKFAEVKRICSEKGLQYSMQFPAVLWIDLGEKRQRFEDPAAAKSVIKNYQPAEETGASLTA